MAPPAFSWSDGLPVDLLVLVFLHLHCLADRATFAAVCGSWRDAKRRAEADPLAPPPPRQIPWLLSPSASEDQGPSITSFLSGTRRRIRRLPADLSQRRLCGAHTGGWVAAVLGPCGVHLLANVFSGARIGLPHRMRLPILDGFSAASVTPVIIRAVMLSAAPTADHCLAGAIVCGSSNVAFCRPGVDLYWNACYPVNSGIQDMVYYEGELKRGFHVLTGDGSVGVFTTASTNDGRGAGIDTSATYYTMRRLAQDKLLSFLPKSTSVTRYLVVSRQRLLMVVRHYCRNGSGVRRTLLFKVFEMQVMKLQQGRHKASWSELNGLDGRVLFVGRGCSRAYEASQFHGFKEGCIYFLDDTEIDILSALSDAPVYPCSDVGMYSMSEIVRRPSLDAPSANMRSPVYGIKTYLSWVDNKEAKKALVEMTEEDEARHSRSKIMGTRWGIHPSEPVSKFSPPIWFAP